MSIHQSIIKANNIFKAYYSANNLETQVLKGLSIEIHKGEFTAIMGPSGAGKSTLLHLLGSLDKPDAGNIELSIDDRVIDYNNLTSNEKAYIRNKHIGFIFQFHHLLPEFTAIENIMIPSMIAGNSRNVALKEASRLLDLVGMSSKGNNKPMELSGGEQQRVAIARALINQPSIVFADEPTGNLDSANATSVLNLIQELRNNFKMTFVVATHSLDVATISERTLFINDGRIVNN
jgi:lipoprotein-releasing system ATP-binding protein